MGNDRSCLDSARGMPTREIRLIRAYNFPGCDVLTC